MALQDIPPEQLERVVGCNVTGLMAVVRCLLPGMRERKKGRIALVSSMAGQASVYGYSVYGASKFALRGFAEALRQEVLPFRIGVTLAFPPDTDTPMLEKENAYKPNECKRISGAVETVSADAVARGVVRGMMRGDFLVGFGTDGFLLNHLTVGMLPQTFSDFVVNVFILPLIRIVGVAHTLWFDHIVMDEHLKKLKARA